MKSIQLSIIALMAFTTSSSIVNAGIIEQGDLNIIDQAGNASDGLRFLDMTYSDGKTLAAALADAQAAYANARLATPSEWDDLFQAVDITYNGSLKASDAFTDGTFSLLVFADAGAIELAQKLGTTHLGQQLFVWSDPDGSSANTSTRDFIQIAGLTHPNAGSILVQQSVNTPHNEFTGWFIVSEASSASVPEPSSLAILGLMSCAGIFRRRRRNGMTP